MIYAASNLKFFMSLATVTQLQLRPGQFSAILKIPTQLWFETNMLHIEDQVKQMKDLTSIIS